VERALIEQIKFREEVGLKGVSAKNSPQPGAGINRLEELFNGLKTVFSHTDGQQTSMC